MVSRLPWSDRLRAADSLFSHTLIQPAACLFAVVYLMLAPCMALAAPVVVVAAELRQLTPAIQVAGTVISRNDARLAAQVGGQVTWVTEVGTRLERGELVAQLENVIIRKALVEAEAGILHEQADVTFYKADVKRLSQLVKDNHVAQSSLDQAQHDLSVARSELSAARARAEQARENLQRTGIRAPFAGLVSALLIEVGEWADPGASIVRLVDTEALEVRAWVPLTALPFIHPQAEFELTAQGRVSRAKLRALVPVGDEKSRLSEIRLSLGDGAWIAGQGVRIAIPTAESQSAVVIPRDALVLRVAGASVFRILDDNTAERINVIPGTADGDWITVSGGINPGDRVVVRGGERLRAGDSVTVTGLESNE